jgi:hypothetical protein
MADIVLYGKHRQRSFRSVGDQGDVGTRIEQQADFGQGLVAIADHGHIFPLDAEKGRKDRELIIAIGHAHTLFEMLHYPLSSGKSEETGIRHSTGKYILFLAFPTL